MASVIARDFKPDTHEEELFITQSAFRAVMDAMARPGQLRKLSAMYHPQGQRASTQGQFGTLFENRYLETLVCMLLDSSCTIVTGSDASTAAVSARSYAQPSEPDKARFAIITKDVPAKRGAELLAMLSGGSDLAPELGATAIIECQALAGESPARTLFSSVPCKSFLHLKFLKIVAFADFRFSYST